MTNSLDVFMMLVTEYLTNAHSAGGSFTYTTGHVTALGTRELYTVKTLDKRTTHWVPAVCPIDIKTDRPAVECGYTDCSSYGRRDN